MGASLIIRYLRDLFDVNTTGAAPGDVLGTTDGVNWTPQAGGGGGGPPTGAAGGVLGGTYPNPAFAVDMATQAELDAHINDPTDAHDGSAISNIPAGTISSTDVQAALNELDGQITTSLSDAVILAPASSARNVIQPTAGAVIAAIVKAHAAQSVDLTQWQDSTGAVLGSMGLAGVVTHSPSAGTIVPGLVPAFDDTTLFDIVAPAGYRNAGGNFPWFWRVMSEEGLMTLGLDDYGDMWMLGATGQGPSGIFMRGVDNPDLQMTLYGGVLPPTQGFIYCFDQSLGNPDLTNSYFAVGPDGGIWMRGAKSIAGTGTPEGAVTAPVGSVFQRTDGSTGTTFYIKESGAGNTGWVPVSTSSGAPTTATYITQTADAGLSAEQALSALATGLVKNTTGTGVLSIGVANTDYAAATHATRHQDGGADEISLTGLSGEPADTVNKSLFDANTVLAANADNTPAAVTMGASTILARLAAGNIKAATPAELRTLLDVPTNAEAILDVIIDAKGDVLAGTAADTVARVAVGTDGYALTADSTATPGVAWAPSWPYRGLTYRTGHYYIHDTAGVVASAAAVIAQDIVTAVPFPVRTKTTFDRIACFQSVNGSATTVHRMGIYNDNGGGYPGSRLLDAGTVDGAAGGAVAKEITINQELLPGLYWLVHVGQVATPASTLNSTTAAIASHWQALPTVAVNSACYRQTGVTGALGTPFTTTVAIHSTGTIMWLRAA